MNSRIRLHADPRLFTLDDSAWNQFLAGLDRPVVHKPRLAELFSEPSIFDATASARADAFRPEYLSALHEDWPQ